MGYITKDNHEPVTTAVKIKLALCLVVGTLFLAAAILSIIVDPLRLLAIHSARVDYGTAVHQAMSEEVDSLHLSAYLFNITNAEQFLSGEDEKLKVEEVGPFVYQENRTNEDLEIDLAAGVMRYTPRHKVTFLPEESVGRPEDIMLTVPNVAMLSMGSMVSTYGYFARMGFNMLTAQLNTKPTIQLSAQDYLWGYDEPLINLGNTILPGWINFDKMGVLDRLYDETTPFRVEVSASDEDKFMIKTIDGIGGLSAWGYPEQSSNCNNFNGSFEGIGYPPEMPPDRPVKIYRNVLCRFMELEYTGPKMMDFGVKGMTYKFSNKSYQIEGNECLCSKGVCHEGVSDMSACMYGLPLVLSNAHFLDASPSLYDRIEGLTPNEEDHGSSFIVEPLLGMVMATKFSVQVSVMMRDVGFNSKLASFSDMFVPIVNVKIVQPKLKDQQISTLRMVHIYMPYAFLGLQVILFISGILLVSYSSRQLYWNCVPSRKKGISYVADPTDVKEVFMVEPLMNR
uniref:Scavenger receptor class B member 1 n=1 Tax=Heliothis virescens TaxID=7102 RepID=A0A2A4JT04_HELVI